MSLIRVVGVRSRSLVILAVALASAGCHSSREAQLEGQVRNLQAQLDESRIEVMTVKTRMAAMQTQMAIVQDRADHPVAVMPAAPDDATGDAPDAGGEGSTGDISQ